jgi:hypothetical protein
LNPLEWLKSIYELFGAKYPTASLIGVMIVGALFAGVLWRVGAQQYEKSRASVIAPAQTPQTGVVTTAGPCSPIITGNGNAVTADCEDSDKKTSNKVRR